MWRKKVDATFLKDGSTPIPKWLLTIWDIQKAFEHVRSKKDPSAQVNISLNKQGFERQTFDGQVAKIKHSTGYRYRLYFEEKLIEELRKIYLMSFMRSLEAELSESSSNRDIEGSISFWEFIDIEFDVIKKTFIFSPHYQLKPQFPNLFNRLVNSAPLKRISAEILDKDSLSIHKQDWSERNSYKLEVGAHNVIYMLLDEVSKLIYVGEAKDMIRRFNAGHPDIKQWTHYKYNVLPDTLAPYRLTIERMLIRDMACILINKQNIRTFQISEFSLANRKIDK
jgi:hypothetical protein